ncbi:hypothetical protein [Microvirga aerophila]|uniref:Chemotaxis methyl-accepting receptor HlyB-like 4HB MCP domain-containing protein n=1 Tax=Microvirga aerophila TaxID=670291 RepID=A0A512BM50_9HYPH|nr:hypothetical protein [Microvirga aerophila]GEO13040.1 hypothetical protein MAE02_07360 [Microvirga aerophila]
MRVLNNLKLSMKLAIPVTVFLAITAGLIVLAKTGLDRMAVDTQELVDVDAARLTAILQINAEVNEASIQEKNLILFSASEPERLKSAEAVYQQYKKLAMQHIDELIALSDTPAPCHERRDQVERRQLFHPHGQERRLQHEG